MTGHTAHRRSRARQRGAALLTAMVVVTLVATLAAGMIWQQWRAVQVESAERARTQSQWILVGAIDWARLILREDKRSGNVDHLGEPWALPLAEAKLSTFLAADRENTDDAPDAFLSGQITDAQSRYNLRNLAEPLPDAASEERVLARLLTLVGAPAGLASTLGEALRAARPGAAAASAPGSTDARRDPPLMPERVDQLAWLGLDAATLRQIEPYVTLLPVRTPVNLNTASKEVLAAAIEGLDLASAERIVQARQSRAFESVSQLSRYLPEGMEVDAQRIAFASSFFEVRGRLRLQERVVEERALVERRNLEIVPLRRERLTALDRVGP